MKLPKGFKMFPHVPYPFQIETINYGIKHDNIGLLLSMGLGKTVCSITIARWRIQNDGCRKVLVICPVSIMRKWQGEIHKSSEYKATVVHGTKAERIRLLKEKSEFYIINYEALTPLYQPLEDMKFDILIADESARYIQNPTSNRSLAAIQLSDIAKYRMILTGTLISKRPMNLWSQFRFLTRGETFGDNFYKFRSKMFTRLDLSFEKFVLKKQYIPIINKGIYSACIKFTRDEIKDELPEVLPTVETFIEMDRDLQLIYDSIKKNIITEIETEKGHVTLKKNFILSRLTKLQQITSGFIKNKGEQEEKLRSTPKLDALIEEVASITDDEESVIIWCRFRFSISMIELALKKLKIKTIVMTGSDSQESKNEKWNRFQRSKTFNVFVGQIEAGGIGIELFKIDGDKDKTQHTLFFDRTWVFDHAVQAAGRSDRIGQKSKIRKNHFVVENSIDQIMYNTQKDDKEVAELIMKQGIRKFLK